MYEMIDENDPLLLMLELGSFLAELLKPVCIHNFFDINAHEIVAKHYSKRGSKW